MWDCSKYVVKVKWYFQYDTIVQKLTIFLLSTSFVTRYGRRRQSAVTCFHENDLTRLKIKRVVDDRNLFYFYRAKVISMPLYYPVINTISEMGTIKKVAWKHLIVVRSEPLNYSGILCYLRCNFFI